LNESGWKKEDGGMLRVWKVDDATNKGATAEKINANEGTEDALPAVDIMPEGGRIAMFYSDKVPHEVTATNSNRYALTVWYYDGVERSEAVAKSQELQSGDEKGDMEAQLEASEFIKNTLANENMKDLAMVGTLAGKLSEKAIRICAGICGLPSEEAFRAAANNLTDDGLRELREGLQRMGV